MIIASLLAAVVSAATASACSLNVTVACPEGGSKYGIKVCATDCNNTTVCAYTDDTGLAQLELLGGSGTYTVCVDPKTLPAGASLCSNGKPCTTVDVCCDVGASVTFDLCGDFCTPPEHSACWMTGGGTIGGKKGTPDFSYGGVVYPGCSPKAAEGGNWNVIDHNAGLHFQGQAIVVDNCSGDPTGSPKVNVRTIDFHGQGILSGIGGNPAETIPVTFVARATDNHDGGSGADQLYLNVTVGSTTVMQIGTSAALPATISTGNIQIHTSSCGK